MEKMYIKKSKMAEVMRELGGNENDLKSIESVASIIYEGLNIVLIDDDFVNEEKVV